MALASQNSDGQCNQFRKHQQQCVNPDPFCERLKIPRKDRCYQDAAGNRDQPVTRTRDESEMALISEWMEQCEKKVEKST